VGDQDIQDPVEDISVFDPASLERMKNQNTAFLEIFWAITTTRQDKPILPIIHNRGYMTDFTIIDPRKR
jgi:ribosomal protein S8